MRIITISFLILVSCWGCGSSSSRSSADLGASPPNPCAPGYYCDASGVVLGALLPGTCASPTDCSPPYNDCSQNNTCVITQAASASGQIWFATDPIRPGVVSTCNANNCGTANSNDYVYNIMAKGYASLDDWCMSQAQQSTDVSVRNKSNWEALIIANGDYEDLGTTYHTYTTQCFPLYGNGCPWISRVQKAFQQRSIQGGPNIGNCNPLTGFPPACTPLQQNYDNYLNPNGTLSGGENDGIFDKFGNSIKGQPPNQPSGTFTSSFSWAWLGIDHGTITVQTDQHVGCSFISLNPNAGIGAPGCLVGELVNNINEWSAGQYSTSSEDMYRMWSQYNGSTFGSLYLAYQDLSAAAAGFTYCNFPGVPGAPSCGVRDSHVLPTDTKQQNRIICLSN